MVSISLDISFLIQMGLFLVLVYLLNTLIYRPILRVMAERANRIASMTGEAGKADADIETRMVDYRKKLDEAKVRGAAERVALKKTGTDKETELLETAHEEANRKIEQARARIASEKENAIASLKGIINELGGEIAGKTIGRTL